MALADNAAATRRSASRASRSAAHATIKSERTRACRERSAANSATMASESESATDAEAEARAGAGTATGAHVGADGSGADWRLADGVMDAESDIAVQVEVEVDARACVSAA